MVISGTRQVHVGRGLGVHPVGVARTGGTAPGPSATQIFSSGAERALGLSISSGGPSGWAISIRPSQWVAGSLGAVAGIMRARNNEAGLLKTMVNMTVGFAIGLGVTSLARWGERAGF